MARETILTNEGIAKLENSSLRKLNIEWNKTITELPSLPCLIKLNAWNTNLTNAGIAKLENSPLQTLNIYGNQTITVLPNLPNLTELDASNIRLTNEAIDKLTISSPLLKQGLPMKWTKKTWFFEQGVL